MKILLSGCTGFIGSLLMRRLIEGGHELFVLTRNPAKIDPALRHQIKAVVWNAHTVSEWAEVVENADAVINLAGENLAGKKWSGLQKVRLVESRIQSTRAIVTAIKNAVRKPKVLINASAIGYYGHVPEGDVTESSGPGTGFLPETCQKWEIEALKAQELGLRVVLLRTGIVLEKSAGAVAKMIPPFKFYIGGPLGTGKQWMSWIHLEDEVEAILFLLQNEVEGPVNLTAPQPVRMKDFAKAFGKAMGRPSWAPVPGLMLKLLLGEMSSIVLEGQKVLPSVLEKSGFQFKYPAIQPALDSILK